MKKIRIGSGAGYAGDRIEPAVELMEKGDLDYIIFECLAERTVAIGQQDKWLLGLWIAPQQLHGNLTPQHPAGPYPLPATL